MSHRITVLSLLLLSLPRALAPQSLADVMRDPAQYAGKRVEWLGRQVRLTTETKQGRRVILSRTFVVAGPAAGNGEQAFLVEGPVEESGEAPSDSGVRRVRGTIAGIEDIVVYINGTRKTVVGPKLIKAAIDAPRGAAQ
jgi:hypothetical protein